MPRATTVRFTEEVFARLDQASARTGLPVNSIVVAACLEWMQRHAPGPSAEPLHIEAYSPGPTAVTGVPRWATISRAVKLALTKQERPGMYPFERFTDRAKDMLMKAQAEAEKAGFSYIGTEHLLFAAFGKDFHSALALAGLGVEEEAVRSTIKSVLGRARAPWPQPMTPTSRVKKVIEIAFGLSVSRGFKGEADARVGTHHILLALAVEGDGIAAHVLKDLGATRKRIEDEIAKLTGTEA